MIIKSNKPFHNQPMRAIIGLEGAVASLSPSPSMVSLWLPEPAIHQLTENAQESSPAFILQWLRFLDCHSTVLLFANLNCFVSFISYILVCSLNCSLLRYSFYQSCLVPGIVLYSVKIKYTWWIHLSEFVHEVGMIWYGLGLSARKPWGEVW